MEQGRCLPIAQDKVGIFQTWTPRRVWYTWRRVNSVPLLRHQLSSLIKRDLCTASELKPALVCPTPPFLLPVELWNAWPVVWTTCLSKVLPHPLLLEALQRSRLCLSKDSSFPTTVDHTENCDRLSFKVRPGWWRKTKKVFSILGEWKQNVFSSKPGQFHPGCPRCRVEDSVNKFTLDPANTAPNLPNICLKIKCIAPPTFPFSRSFHFLR